MKCIHPVNERNLLYSLSVMHNLANKCKGKGTFTEIWTAEHKYKANQPLTQHMNFLLTEHLECVCEMCSLYSSKCMHTVQSPTFTGLCNTISTKTSNLVHWKPSTFMTGAHTPRNYVTITLRNTLNSGTTLDAMTQSIDIMDKWWNCAPHCIICPKATMASTFSESPDDKYHNLSFVFCKKEARSLTPHHP